MQPKTVPAPAQPLVSTPVPPALLARRLQGQVPKIAPSGSCRALSPAAGATPPAPVPSLSVARPLRPEPGSASRVARGPARPPHSLRAVPVRTGEPVPASCSVETLHATSLRPPPLPRPPPSTCPQAERVDPGRHLPRYRPPHPQLLRPPRRSPPRRPRACRTAYALAR